MNIIFLNRFFYPDLSATSQILSDLAFHLARTPAHTVIVITSRQRYDDPTADLPPRETINGVKIRRVRAPRFGRQRLAGRALDYLGFYLGATMHLWRVARQGDIVVAKTDPPMLSIPAALVSRAKHLRLINWLQDLFPEVALALGVRGLNGTMGRALRAVRNWSLQRAAMNVAIGNLMRERLHAEGILPTKITVIPNWADGAAIQPIAPAENNLRRTWGLDGRFVIGYSGNLGRAHEFKTIIDAAEILSNDSRLIFLFIGAGLQLDRVRTAVYERKLSNVIFRPYQPREKLHLSLGATDVHIVVLRPELEGLIVPSKVYGCLAAGRPVIFIGDTAGEVARLVAGEEVGFTCGIGQPERLAAHILRLYQPGVCRVMGAKARVSFEAHYDKPHGLAQFDALLRTACTEPTPRRDQPLERERQAIHHRHHPHRE